MWGTARVRYNQTFGDQVSSSSLKTQARSTAPTWAEISLCALQHNFRTVQDYVAPGATVCAVVKADAYGHGVVECARAFEKEGATWLGVTSVEEGVKLREGGVTSRILVLRGFVRGEEDDVVRHELTPAIWEWSHVELLEDAAERLGKTDVPVHLKVDTGMARLGVSRADLPEICQTLKSAQHVLLEGLFSHFASAEIIDAPETEAQMERFDDAAEVVIKHGLSPIYYHLANSAAVITRANSWRNFVRTGIALYGYFLPVMSIVTGHPDKSHELPVMPALSWKTRILAIRDVDAHQPLGYNGAYVTQSPARIAALPVGYADGLDRQLTNRGRVIVRDDYAQIVGNIAMDITLVDITGIPGVDVGDEVILIGSSTRRTITAWDHAIWASTLPYEILCGLSKRVPRIYVE